MLVIDGARNALGVSQHSSRILCAADQKAVAIYGRSIAGHAGHSFVAVLLCIYAVGVDMYR